MPNKFVTLDTGFPTFTGSESLPEKVDAIVNYQYQLQESLRYMLRHLGSENFDEDGLKSITEPIAISLREDFNQTEISIDPSGIEAVISGLESTLEMYVKSDVFEATIKTLDDDITQMRLDMDGIETSVKNAEGDASQALQTANSFSTRIATAEGNASTALQTANSFETRIATAEGNASTALQTADSLKTTVASQGNKISTLEQTATSLKSTVSSNSTKISTLEQNSTEIEASVSDLETGMSTTLHLTSSGLRIGSSNGTKTTIDGGYIAANSITADKLNVGSLSAGTIQGDTIYVKDSAGDNVGFIYTTDTETGSGVEIETYLGGAKMTSYGGNIYLKSYKSYGDYLGAPFLLLGRANANDPLTGICQFGHGALVLDDNSFGDYLPDNPVYGQVYFLRN